jgi:hypothetical protein
MVSGPGNGPLGGLSGSGSHHSEGLGNDEWSRKWTGWGAVRI